MNLSSRLRVALTLISWSSIAACGAPGAAPIEGDIATVIDRGIAEGSETFDHSAWDEILATYAVDGGRRFDYAGLAADKADFDGYLEALAEVDLATLPSRELQALFVNAYNAHTVATVLERVREDGTFAIESIRDVSDVFGREVHEVGGFTLSLDNIEHNILRPVFKDPRFHFAVNCASISCPPLPTDAFTGERLDEQLEASTRNALTNPDYVAVAPNGPNRNDALLVTKIFEWYGTDFVNPEFSGSEKTLPAFVAKYASEDVIEFIAAKGTSVDVEFRDYDWSLNKP